MDTNYFVNKLEELIDYKLRQFQDKINGHYDHIIEQEIKKIKDDLAEELTTLIKND